MYAFKYEIDGKLKEKKTAKGIKKYVIKKDIHFQNYKDTIFTKGKEQQFASMNCIRSKKHNLMTIRVNKIGLSTYDNKRYVCDDNINTYAHGHKDIKNDAKKLVIAREIVEIKQKIKKLQSKITKKAINKANQN